MRIRPEPPEPRIRVPQSKSIARAGRACIMHRSMRGASHEHAYRQGYATALFGRGRQLCRLHKDGERVPVYRWEWMGGYRDGMFERESIRRSRPDRGPDL